MKDIIGFINGDKSTKSIKITKHSISKLRNRKLFWRPVPRTNENLKFVAYIKDKFPDFRDDLFLKN